MPKRTKCFTDQSLLYKYNSAKDITEYEWLPHTPERKLIKKKIISKSPTYSPIGGYSPPKPLWKPVKKIISKSPTYSPIGGYSLPKPLWLNSSSPVKKKPISPVKKLISPVKKKLISPVMKKVSSPVKKKPISPVKKLISPVMKKVSSPVKKKVSSPVKKKVSSPVKKKVSSPVKTKVSSPESPLKKILSCLFKNRDEDESDDKFLFYSKSADAKPGKGKGENTDDVNKFKELEKVKNWRKMLSNFYVSPFILDDNSWNSVEHFFHAVKFRNDKKPGKNFEYYKTFTLTSNSPWSVDPLLSKGAGKAGRISETTGKVFDKKIGDTKIPKDVQIRKDFYSAKIDDKLQYLAFLAKFTQNDVLKDMLLKTNDAELWHFVGRGAPNMLWKNLMNVRECIREFDHIYNLKEISKMSTNEVTKIISPSSKDGSRKQTKCFLDKSLLNKYKSKSSSLSYKYTTDY